MAIQIRRGLNAQWESQKGNIVAGEPAIATDTGRFFVGTGTGTYVEFPSIDKVVDMIYPVGSIYMSVNSADPSALFGGTWEQIEDTFLLSAGSTYNAGDTGGEAAHSLSQGELPRITGRLNTYSSTPGYKGGLFADATGVFSMGDVRNDNLARGSNSYEPPNKSATIVNMDFGNNEAHNNMPPYLVVYVWKRTA